MAQGKRKTRGKRTAGGLRQELKQDLIAIAFFAVGLFVAFCLWQVPKNGERNLLGALGYGVYSISQVLFGQGKWFFPTALLLLGISQWFRATKPGRMLYSAYAVVAACFCAISHLFLPAEQQLISIGMDGLGGGLIGGLLVQSTNRLIGSMGSWLLYLFLAIGAVLIITGKTLGEMMREAGGQAQKLAKSAQNGLSHMGGRQEENIQLPKSEIIQSLNVPIDTELRLDKSQGDDAPATQAVQAIANREIAYHDFNDRHLPEVELQEKGGEADQEEQGETPAKGGASAAKKTFHGADLSTNSSGTLNPLSKVTEYQLPSLQMLKPSSRIKSQRINKDITDNVRVLEETLSNFGVKAVVTQVNRGPSITRYELQPAPGVKVSKIVGLSDDLALALAAAHIRIEAPIPGKAAVGIEVPNAERTPVSLREVLEDPAFRESRSKLTFALGRDIAGAPMVADLARMPHLLIAGSTGSGKSVCMNALIASILFCARPDEVKMMMIDPKMVELSNYNGIPHLIYPVVTDAKKAAKALRWAVHEMEKRYDTFAKAGVKDIERYNHWLAAQPKGEDKPGLLPQIVILIDELADLMMVAPADVEDAICRLAQMARAAGMHLVVATQRPSVDVITGVIKTNIPSRIAFAVSSQTDSRVILDGAGAEKLLGRGDMLFYTLEKPKPMRVQGVYVSDKEIESLCEYWQGQNSEVEYSEDVMAVPEVAVGEEEEALDALLPEAARIFIESGQASISLLQRRLRIGYTRAARIIDQMEEQGIVGGFEGSKARTIRMSMQQYEERFGNKGQTIPL